MALSIGTYLGTYRRIGLAEEVLRELSQEVWLLFNADGHLIHRTEGNRYQVGIPKQVMQCLRPVVSVHNHIWEIGHSEGDIMTAIGCDFLESRVITPEYRYRLIKPPEGWPVCEVAEAFLTKEWGMQLHELGDGDPAAYRRLRRRIFQQAHGHHVDPADHREVLAWATCSVWVCARFAEAFAAQYLVEPLAKGSNG